MGDEPVHEKTSEETDFFSESNWPKISVRITVALSKPTQTIFNPTKLIQKHKTTFVKVK